MSRYDDPDDHQDAEEYPASAEPDRGPAGRRQVGENTGGWGGRERRRPGEDTGSGGGRERRRPGEDTGGGGGLRHRPGEDTGSWMSWRRSLAVTDGPDDAERSGRSGVGSIFRRHPIVSALAVLLTVAVTGVTLTAYAAYRNVYDGIHHLTITGRELGGNRPPELVPGALNILLIGSDSRAGTNGQYGATSGANAIQGSRSDTSMVLHISPDHAHATIISLPRDSLVPIYSCNNDGQGHPGQQAQPGQQEALNWTFSFGGVACLWKTIEQTTRIRIDYFAEVDFSGFKKIINDVGGVKVCIPFAIDNAQSGLHLSAGVHNVTGAQALAFVRLRENIGYGSDTQRIQRQQFFLASALQKVKQTNLLTDPQQIYRVVRDAASSLTTNMTLNNLIAIANSLKGLNISSVQFVTVPVADDPTQYGRLDWVQPQADQLFAAIRHDTKIPKSAKKKAAKASTPTPTPTAQPSQVQVDVLNGTTRAGLAGATATALTGKGFVVTGTGDATVSNYSDSYIEYGTSSQMPEVNALAQEVPGAVLKKTTGLAPGTLTLILGTSFTQLGEKAASTSRTSSLGNLTQNYSGISANTNICSDQQAFAGPDTPTVP